MSCPDRSRPAQQALISQEVRVRNMLQAGLLAHGGTAMLQDPETKQWSLVPDDCFAPEGILLFPEEESFSPTACDPPYGTARDSWTWVALLNWNCIIATDTYLDKLRATPPRALREGNLGHVVARVDRVEHIWRPSQSSPDGTSLRVFFTVTPY